MRRLDDRREGRSIALLGTSASPITNAHLTVALEVLAPNDVDEVWILLVGQHLRGKPPMPAQPEKLVSLVPEVAREHLLAHRLLDGALLRRAAAAFHHPPP